MAATTGSKHCGTCLPHTAGFTPARPYHTAPALEGPVTGKGGSAEGEHGNMVPGPLLGLLSHHALQALARQAQQAAGLGGDHAEARRAVHEEVGGAQQRAGAVLKHPAGQIAHRPGYHTLL